MERGRCGWVQKLIRTYKTFKNIIDISCGSHHSVALRSDGTIECWGSNQYRQCDIDYKTFTNVIKIF